MIIKSGLPAVIAASSPALGSAVIETTPQSISVTNVLSNILAEFTDAGVIVIDCGSGEIHASSLEATRNALLASVGFSDELVIAPDAGQEGRSLAFNVQSGALSNVATADLVTAVKPKFTIESLTSRIMSKLQEREAAEPGTASKHAIVIDQVNKVIRVGMMDDEASSRTALLGVSVAAAQGVRVEITPDGGEPSSNPLPFEGGAV